MIRLWLLRILGVALFSIGVVLAVGGIKLAFLGGSLYYVFIGLLLIASGILVTLSRVLGLHLYVLAFLLTLVWSLFEVGLDGWALVPRLVGPFILLILVLLVMSSHQRNGKRTGRGYGVALAMLSAFGLAVAVPLAHSRVCDSRAEVEH